MYALDLDLDRPTDEMPSQDPLLHRVFHGFRIEKLIGQGSAAKIYYATHCVLEREYAVKILQRGLTTIHEAVERVRREANVLSRIHHPNVVEVFDYGETDEGQPFIAMEMLHGTTLRDFLEEHGRLSTERAASLAKQLAAGLAEAHRHGLIHRDLKPDNIMLIGDRGFEQVKILDFGLARIAAVDSPVPQITKHDILLGTPRYMAPEQILAPSSAGPSSDLYALGVIVYEMLSGNAPFTGAIFEVIAQQLNRTPPPLAEDGQLERLVMRLLAKDPADRPADAVEVLLELDATIRAQQQTLLIDRERLIRSHREAKKKRLSR